MMDPQTPLTELLRLSSSGDEAARLELEPLLYRELYQIAQAHMAGQRAEHTLQSTALVHEAWLKLADPPPASGPIVGSSSPSRAG